MKIVLANGCFDLLHPGHVAHLQEARAMGDYLIVGLTRDECVNKPRRPVQDYSERKAMLEALECVNEVFGCRSGAQAISEIGPDIFVKGADYVEKGLTDDEYDACAHFNVEIRFTTTPKKSTTELIERIKCAS